MTILIVLYKTNYDYVPKVLRHFLPKYWENNSISGPYKRYLRVVQKRPIQPFTSWMSKMDREGGKGSRPLLNNVQKKHPPPHYGLPSYANLKH